MENPEADEHSYAERLEDDSQSLKQQSSSTAAVIEGNKIIFTNAAANLLEAKKYNVGHIEINLKKEELSEQSVN